MRAGCSRLLPTELAALLGGMSWWRDSGDRSSATCPHHGPTGVDPGSNAMVEVGTLSNQSAPPSSINLGKQM